MEKRISLRDYQTLTGVSANSIYRALRQGKLPERDNGYPRTWAWETIKPYIEEVPFRENMRRNIIMEQVKEQAQNEKKA